MHIMQIFMQITICIALWAIDTKVGAEFPSNTAVIKGHFFLGDALDMTYKLDARVLCLSMLFDIYVQTLKNHQREGQEGPNYYKLSLEHQEGIMGNLQF